MTDKKFSFKFETEDLVREEILNLHGSKVTPIGDITVDIVKPTVNIHLTFITSSMNFSSVKGCFPEKLKLAEVSPIFTKKDDLDKDNYKHISVLAHVSKVVKRIMYHKKNDYSGLSLSRLVSVSNFSLFRTKSSVP